MGIINSLITGGRHLVVNVNRALCVLGVTMRTHLDNPFVWNKSGTWLEILTMFRVTKKHGYTTFLLDLQSNKNPFWMVLSPAFRFSFHQIAHPWTSRKRAPLAVGPSVFSSGSSPAIDFWWSGGLANAAVWQRLRFREMALIFAPHFWPIPGLYDLVCIFVDSKINVHTGWQNGDCRCSLSTLSISGFPAQTSVVLIILGTSSQYALILINFGSRQSDLWWVASFHGSRHGFHAHPPLIAAVQYEWLRISMNLQLMGRRSMIFGSGSCWAWRFCPCLKFPRVFSTGFSHPHPPFWGSHSRSGWWFGCHFLFSHSVGNLIIPIDFHIFQRGGWTTNQRMYQNFSRFGLEDLQTWPLFSICSLPRGLLFSSCLHWLGSKLAVWKMDKLLYIMEMETETKT